jgi:hypothetical protein
MSILNLQKSRGVLYAFNGTKLLTAEGQKGDAFTSSTWADLEASFNRLFVATGSSNIVRVIDLDLTSRDTTATVDLYGYKLRAGCMTMHKGLMYAGNIPETDGEHVSRLRWSAFGEPENFTPFGAGNYQSFQDVGDPLDPIVRLVSVGNDLYIFKRNSVWMASGVASDFVGPETIYSISTQVGLVGANAVTTDGQMVKFISDGGIYALVNRTVKKIYDDVWQQFDWRPREHWGACSITEDFANDRVYSVMPTENKTDTEVYVKSEYDRWSKWTWTRNMTLVKAISGQADAYFGDEWDGVYTPDETKRADFSSNDRIDSTWDTGWVQPSKQQMRCLLRSIEFMVRQEGEFYLKIEVFKDMNMVAEDVKYIQLNGKDVVVTDRAVTDSSSTASYDNYYHHFVDITSSAYAVRIRVSTYAQANNRFKILQTKLGYIERGGV